MSINKIKTTDGSVHDINAQFWNGLETSDLVLVRGEGSYSGVQKTDPNDEYSTNTASGDYSMASGYGATASGFASHTEGFTTTASGFASHAEGIGTMANNQAEHSEGKYNVSNNDTIHSVGIGSSNIDRKNAHEITQDGKHYIYGIGGYDGTNPDSGEDVATVINDMPIVKGDAEHSAVLKGMENVSGLKGYVITHIDFSNKSIYVSDATDITNTQPISGAGTIDSSFLIEYNVGDTISITNNKKHYNCSTITSIGNNKITVNELPFEEILTHSNTVPVNYVIYCLNKHNVGSCNIGGGAVAIGSNNAAINFSAYSEGYNNESYGHYSHTEGRDNIAGFSAHAEGRNTQATDSGAHSEGLNTKASAVASHAEGYTTTASGLYAHSEGNTTTASGANAHAEGYWTTAEGPYSHAEGVKSHAEGQGSHAEGGYSNTIVGGHAVGFGSHAEGAKTLSEGNYSHAEGYFSKANGIASHAEGGYNDNFRGGIANGTGSHAEGGQTTADGIYSHAEGQWSIAGGVASHTEGYKTQATKNYSHAEGNESYANGVTSHAEGYKTQANGNYSHTEGIETETSNNLGEHAEGRYNVSNSTTIHSVGIGTSDTDRKNAHEIMLDGKHYIIGIGGYNGTNPTEYNDVATYLPNLVEITYSDLVNLKGNYVPGQQYRITDYVTTTVQANTQVANPYHQFDLIVTADDESTLNENARACLHDGDTYFTTAGADLNAWELKYCIDNDTERFAWADADNGKGVIYYMKDEYGNECPYDFKNIMFIRYQLEAPATSGYPKEWINQLATNISNQITNNQLSYIWGGLDENNRYWDDYSAGCYSTNTGTTKAFYTFSNIINEVVSDHSLTTYCYNNTIKEYISSNILQLNNNVFFNTSTTSRCHDNSFGNGCYNNSFGEGCFSNSFGHDCKYNSFGYTCYSNSFENGFNYNSFGNGFSSNSFGIYYQYNSFGDNCFSNSFGNGCYCNSFGDNCHENSFGNSCYFNSFGNYCSNNSFGNYCSNNSFGDHCYSNSFENYFSSNSFGEGCFSNSFGNTCLSNYFGDNCCNNSFGNDCRYNSFRTSASTSGTLKNYCYYNHFDDGCSYNVIWNSTDTNYSNRLQNINVNRGVSVTNSGPNLSYNFINITTLNSEQEINVNQVDGIVSIGEVLSIKHKSLVNLRDNGQLIPGRQYRITDYQTVSNQKDTIADGRRFDIIVVADDESTLNENARAIHHDGCNDFEGENLDAWELKYTLTNDDYLYHWGNSGDRIESITIDFYPEYEILSINGDTIEYGSDNGDTYGEWTIDKSKTYNIQGSEYYKMIDGKYYYVPVNYSVGDPVYYFDTWENIDPSFIITNKLITLQGNNYYQLDRYRNYYVSTEYNSDQNIYEYTEDFYPDYEILSINGDTIEYGYAGEDPYGEYTIDKSKTYNIQGSEYYKIIGEEYYYVPVNYSVGDRVYCFDEYIYDQCIITNMVNTPSTTGTIYYMKDEHNNECSYDFKCIKFLKGTDYIYTFGDGCYDNHINPYMINNSSIYELNCITFGNNCYSNSFGYNCKSNSFGYNCHSNSFGYNCKSNSFGYNYYDNSFGNNCLRNSFGNNCYRNSFGYNCHNNSFGNNCQSNSLGYGCELNSFGSDCQSNSLGYSCDNNSLGYGSNYNIFGNNCNNNRFGNYCCYNSLGNDCDNNSFRLSASTTDTLLRYCYHNHFDDGCSYNVIWNSVQPTYVKKLQNINVNRGVSGTSSSYNFINITTLKSEQEINVNQVDGIISIGEVLSIKHKSLVNLRDNGQLIPGRQYRITDYVTTTTQANTQVANPYHQFDLIVTADDESTLNENARAIQHEGDTYFSNSDLTAWELKYCIDNDTTRFVWADDTDNGKGVIYYMKDERGNECPYDFKNIMFIRYQLEAPATSGYSDQWIIQLATNISSQFTNNQLSYIWGGLDENNRYWEDDYIECNSTNTGTTKAFYTFSNIIDGTVSDKSLTLYCYNNVIKEYIISQKLYLNNNVFFNTSNTSLCRSNSFGNYCYSNSFGNECYSNSFGNDCRSNSFGNDCYSNSFGNSCYTNSFGNNVLYNSIGYSCNSNSFGNFCYSNSFGNSCYYNSIGNSCTANSFGNECYYNSFGNNVRYNSFGNYCYSNSFGNDCRDNSFRTSASTSGTLKDYCYYNHFDDGCSYNVIWNSTDTNSNNLLQNINVNRGVSGTISSYNYINITTLNSVEEIHIDKQSNGNIYTYTAANIVSPIVNQTATSVTIQPNVYNKWGEMTALTISLASPTYTSIVNEYMIEFLTGSNSATLSLPSTIEFVGGRPNIEANRIYQISIINNAAVMVSAPR